MDIFGFCIKQKNIICAMILSLILLGVYQKEVNYFGFYEIVQIKEIHEKYLIVGSEDDEYEENTISWLNLLILRVTEAILQDLNNGKYYMLGGEKRSR